MQDNEFDAVKVRDALVEGVRQLARQQHFTRVVVGISGGKDSAVTAAVCARALGKENVYGILLPDGEQRDISDSLRICASLGIPHRTVNIGKMHMAMREIEDPASAQTGEFSVPVSRESDINVGPRLRMTVLRYFAQALQARLAGTGNLSEAAVGYCTKDGDTSCDFAVLLKLTSLEVMAVGAALEELPEGIAHKTPSDGLSGMSDEQKLGISYQAIHDYLRKGTSGNEKVDQQILQKYQASAHKRSLPPVIDPFAILKGSEK